MYIREETSADADAIHILTQKAFAPMPYSSGNEGPIIDQLRRDGDLVLSLVMDDDGSIAGHVAFSKIKIDGKWDKWYCLGPISVTPDKQSQGIGKALVGEGMRRLRALGANGCILIGNPAYYDRLGFKCNGQLRYGGLDASLIQYMTFQGPAPKGALTHADAFEQAFKEMSA
ncbi:putative acetyltransferase [Cohaesibacter marisflavi]|uniref:Putative acetyltransferase n=1 Tax=Cohaesibacter marisflavi TaxID=655353 RepID=A0A1I5KTD8_9HYPH|nr:N-acetyltransferase [Cohaesibacter marisflavi]SFO88370.1 putative acetyltransferase [Cohaesibacter marisflavi]